MEFDVEYEVSTNQSLPLTKEVAFAKQMAEGENEKHKLPVCLSLRINCNFPLT